MPRIKFNQATHLSGKDYTRGTHEVPDDVFGDPYFRKLAEAGLVEDGEAQPTQHQSIQHRQKNLFDRIASQQGQNAERRHLSAVGNIDRSNPPSQPLNTEANPVTGKAQATDLGAAPPSMVGENPAQAAANPEGQGKADANPPDGGTSGQGTAPDAATNGATGAAGAAGSPMTDADVDDLEDELEEETSATGEKTTRPKKKRRHA